MVKILNDMQIDGEAETSGVTLNKVEAKALLDTTATRCEG